MKSKEKEIIDNAARRLVCKKYGFKQSSYINWTVIDGYFFYIVHGTFTKEADLYVKPLYYDDVLWSIVDTNESEKLPDSYRANGSFTAPEFLIKRNLVLLEKDEDFTPEHCEWLWDKVFQSITSQIKEFLTKNPDVDQFTYVNNDSLEVNCDRSSLAIMLEEIHHQNYAKAYQIVITLIRDGKKGNYFFGEDYKSINEYILEYCAKKLGREIPLR